MHRYFLLETLKLASIRRGFCSPNPAVGALLVEKGQVIASAFHQEAGKEHAEQCLLRESAHLISEQTILYISLEPCNHWGKTPPCTDSIIQSGIRQVYFAYHDPNPLVSKGKSSAILKANGIACKALAVSEAASFYQSYKHWLAYKRPFVTAKVAQSLDGKIALAGNRPFALSGKELNAFTHESRYHSDCLLTTAATILADNPQMNARNGATTVVKPLAILDGQLRLTGKERLFENGGPVTIFYQQTRELIHPIAGVNYVPTPANGNHLQLPFVLDHLGRLGVHDLWVEAGGRLFTALFNLDLLNRAYLYITPHLLGTRAVAAFTAENGNPNRQSVVSWAPFGDEMMARIEFTDSVKHPIKEDKV